MVHIGLQKVEQNVDPLSTLVWTTYWSSLLHPKEMPKIDGNTDFLYFWRSIHTNLKNKNIISFTFGNITAPFEFTRKVFHLLALPLAYLTTEQPKKTQQQHKTTTQNNNTPKTTTIKTTTPIVQATTTAIKCNNNNNNYNNNKNNNYNNNNKQQQCKQLQSKSSINNNTTTTI